MRNRRLALALALVLTFGLGTGCSSASLAHAAAAAQEADGPTAAPDGGADVQGVDVEGADLQEVEVEAKVVESAPGKDPVDIADLARTGSDHAPVLAGIGLAGLGLGLVLVDIVAGPPARPRRTRGTLVRR